MKKPRETNHHVKFAAQYALQHLKTFRAFAAMARAEALVDDVEQLGLLKTECEKKGIHFGHFSKTYEIINYFCVGFVTCLEWHARSRLVDLLVHFPHLIEPSDVKNLNNEAVSQMMSERVTVPYLIGAATNVSSVKSYVDILGRVFCALSINPSPEALLRKEQVTIDDHGDPELVEKVTLFQILDQLFTDRHKLVHEISPDVVAHFSLRDMWTTEKAAQQGRLVLQCMEMMERLITEHAPASFPNRLDARLLPENETEKLRSQIAALEEKIEKFDFRWDGEEQDWPLAKAASHKAIEAELAFIEGSGFLRPIRHLDYRPMVQHEFLRLRFAYLKLLADEIDNYPDHGEE